MSGETIEQLRQKYALDEPSAEEIMNQLKEELSTFQKPAYVPGDPNTQTRDILKDIHYALYGNGGTAKGLMWKNAEQTVLIRNMKKREHLCRDQIISHFQKHEDGEIDEDRGVVAFTRRHKKLVAAISVLLFFGVSSLWAIVFDQRQTSKVETAVIAAVDNRLGGTLKAVRDAVKEGNAQQTNSVRATP